LSKSLKRNLDGKDILLDHLAPQEVNANYQHAAMIGTQGSSPNTRLAVKRLPGIGQKGCRLRKAQFNPYPTIRSGVKAGKLNGFHYAGEI
jgi:hypothetical protein